MKSFSFFSKVSWWLIFVCTLCEILAHEKKLERCDMPLDFNNRTTVYYCRAGEPRYSGENLVPNTGLVYTDIRKYNGPRILNWTRQSKAEGAGLTVSMEWSLSIRKLNLLFWALLQSERKIFSGSAVLCHAYKRRTGSGCLVKCFWCDSRNPQE